MYARAREHLMSLQAQETALEVGVGVVSCGRRLRGCSAHRKYNHIRTTIIDEIQSNSFSSVALSATALVTQKRGRVARCAATIVLGAASATSQHAVLLGVCPRPQAVWKRGPAAAQLRSLRHECSATPSAGSYGLRWLIQLAVALLVAPQRVRRWSSAAACRLGLATMACRVGRLHGLPHSAHHRHSSRLGAICHGAGASACPRAVCPPSRPNMRRLGRGYAPRATSPVRNRGLTAPLRNPLVPLPHPRAAAMSSGWHRGRGGVWGLTSSHSCTSDRSSWTPPLPWLAPAGRPA